MKFLDIAIKDLYQLLKDWKAAVFLVASPILFTLMFGFMFGGFGGPATARDDRLPVLVVSDEQTLITEGFLDFLAGSNVIRAEYGDPATSLEKLQQMVVDEDQAAVVRIPAGFSAQVQNAGTVTLEIILDSNTTSGLSVQQELQALADRFQSAAQAAQSAVQIAETQQGQPLTDVERTALFNPIFADALERWQSPPVTALETQTAPSGAQTTGEENAFAQSLPGMMAQFAIAGLMGAAGIVVQERKSGVYDRLLGTAVPKFSFLSGHWLAMFAMILLQFMVLIFFGQLFLRLDFFAAPGATLLLSVASCAFVASLGLLIGILAKQPEQTTIYSLIPMFLFSGLGGAWVPLEVMGEQVQQVSRFTPVYWIMTSFRDVLLRGAGLPDVLAAVWILLGFSVLFFIPAVILFYRQRT